MKFNPEKISLLEVHKNDFADFLELRKSVMKPTVLDQGLPWDEEAENIYHQKLFESEGLLKILSGEDRIGYIGVAETESGDIEISRFCIANEHQGNGLGT